MLVAGGGQDLARVSSTLTVQTFQAAMRTLGDTARGLETSSRAMAAVRIWGKIVRSPRIQIPGLHMRPTGEKGHTVTSKCASERAVDRWLRRAARNARTARVQNTLRPLPCSPAQSLFFAFQNFPHLFAFLIVSTLIAGYGYGNMYCNYAGMQMPYSPGQEQQMGPSYQEQYQQAVRKIPPPPRAPCPATLFLSFFISLSLSLSHTHTHTLTMRPVL
jgi:hypothetical protein